MRVLGLLLIATAVSVVASEAPLAATHAQPSFTSVNGVLSSIAMAPRLPATLAQVWTHGYTSFERAMGTQTR